MGAVWPSDSVMYLGSIPSERKHCFFYRTSSAYPVPDHKLLDGLEERKGAPGLLCVLSRPRIPGWRDSLRDSHFAMKRPSDLLLAVQYWLGFINPCAG